VVGANGSRRSVNASIGMLPGGPRGRGAIYFCVGNRSTNMCSYVWRLWWDRTSFYLTTRDQEMFANLKVSLHGPDDRYASPGLKIGFHRAVPGQEPPPTNGVLVISPNWLPHWFSGHSISDAVAHVLRFRFSFDLFRRGYPSAPLPKEVKKTAFAAVFPPPTWELAVTDVDFYLSKARPYWPLPSRARKNQARLGPLQSDAGDYLTAVAVHRSTIQQPTPLLAQAPRPSGMEDRLRGISTTVDGNGVLWICERWMSRSALLAAMSQ
jgi:hypothetical protein